MAIGGSCGCLVGHSWGGGRHALRVAMDVLGVEHDPLVGPMLAGQQSRPRPGMTIRQRQGN